MPPSGLNGRNAMPSSVHSPSSGSLDRKFVEDWFCTETSRPPRICWASRIWSGFAFEMPAIRILPSSSRSRIAPTDSSYGVAGSVGAIRDLLDEGKILMAGISNANPDQIRLARSGARRELVLHRDQPAPAALLREPDLVRVRARDAGP